MFGPFGDPRVAIRVGQVFGNASDSIRERRSQAEQREKLGNRSRREESDTDELIHVLENAIEKEVKKLQSTISETGVQMDVEFYPTNLPVGEEHRDGADIGLRLHMEGPGFNITKAALFQNKRIYGSTNSFDQIRHDGEVQAARMLDLTPASFFLLFNGLPVTTVGEWLKPPVSWWPFYDEFPDAPKTWPGIWPWT
jgi:hypothetical protein